MWWVGEWLWGVACLIIFNNQLSSDFLGLAGIQFQRALPVPCSDHASPLLRVDSGRLVGQLEAPEAEVAVWRDLAKEPNAS